jgi:hypothetical protein
LLLDVSNEPKVLPVSVTMHTDSSSYGTQIQTEVENNILNLTDGTKGTFWTRNVYLSEPVTKVTTVLEFNLGMAKDINYMIVEGASELVFKIDSIYGIAPDGHRIQLLSEPIEVNGKDRIDFNRVLVRSVYVTFSTNSYVKTDYMTDPKSDVFNYYDSDMSFETVDLIESFGPLASEVLNSDKLRESLNVPSGDSKMINTFVYPFALDNVWFGNAIYEDSGIFVSKPLKGKNLGLCAVQTREVTSTDETVSNSIEYEIIRKDTTPVQKEFKFPIPVLGQTSVTSERLILTKREENSTMADAGALRFCPYVNPNASEGDFISLSSYPVKVYKNGEALQINSDFQIAIRLNTSGSGLEWVGSFTSGTSDTREFSNYLLKPAKMWIKILQPDSTAVYTVDYSIRTSDTYIDDKTMWLDVDKTIFLSNEGQVHFIRVNPDVTIDSELYLQITLRRNTASQVSTPELYEYALLGAAYYN